jgi:hypothetical protein
MATAMAAAAVPAVTATAVVAVAAMAGVAAVPAVALAAEDPTSKSCRIPLGTKKALHLFQGAALLL